MDKNYATGSLRASLGYEPKVLRFGTSGRRGPVVDLTQLEIYINATAELEYLLSLTKEDGGIAKSDHFYYAYDLRPSSTKFVDDKGVALGDGAQAGPSTRGEIAQAIERAIVDAGLSPVNLGAIPTPALTCYALAHGRGSIMVTGSHIPFDRNGYKTNSSKGELLKTDEKPINDRVAVVRDRIYAQPFDQSLFDKNGLFKSGHSDLKQAVDDGREHYVRRYAEFFAGKNLSGKRIVVYQHSAVARDLLVDVLRMFDADVVPAGRSDTFVPIDTENIDDERLKVIQDLADKAVAGHGPIDAVISADGDSDRPLILGVETHPASSLGTPPETGGGRVGSGIVRFFGGDLVGMVVADYLGVDGVVVPISCNDAIDRGPLKDKVQPKTKIGSPYVIVGMKKALSQGKKAVCGWEANGGFLLGSSITKDGNKIEALATRDALLPILSVLIRSVDEGVPVTALFDRLPKRFSKASLITNFPREHSLKIVTALSPESSTIADVRFDGDSGPSAPIIGDSVNATDVDGKPVDVGGDVDRLKSIRADLGKYFTKDLGFGAIIGLNYIDGVRIYFDNGDVAHIRPSGNADELRIYAVADTQPRADDIAKAGVADPDGILRKLAKTYA